MWMSCYYKQDQPNCIHVNLSFALAADTTVTINQHHLNYPNQEYNNDVI